jgi:hypothetical protein
MIIHVYPVPELGENKIDAVNIWRLISHISYYSFEKSRPVMDIIPQSLTWPGFVAYQHRNLLKHQCNRKVIAGE